MSSNKQRAVTAEPHSKVFTEIMREIHDPDFCLNCEWVRLMNPEGKGYCKEHGDIEPSK